MCVSHLQWIDMEISKDQGVTNYAWNCGGKQMVAVLLTAVKKVSLRGRSCNSRGFR